MSQRDGGPRAGPGDPRRRTLIMTVGGSPQPLRSAMEAVSCDRVVFVVSDAASGKSSRTLVEDEEINYGDCKKPVPGRGLRHLAACPGDVRILEVPADNLGEALSKIDAAIACELREGRKIIADYTGGTKTMTAALVLSATAYEGIGLQFMAGLRPDLRQVEAGTERPVQMPRHLIGLAQLFGLARSFVGRRSYQAALQTMSEASNKLGESKRSLNLSVPRTWRQRIDSWQRFVRILDRWDRFDHRDAWEAFEQAEQQNLGWTSTWQNEGLADRLKALADAGGKPSFLLVEDLWLNAMRRADAGNYDDAVARLYRLAEAALQAHLYTRHGIDTARVPPERVCEALRTKLQPSIDPKSGEEFYRLALSDAKALLNELEPDSALCQALEGQDGPAWQSQRNHSILAHGFRSLGRPDWKSGEAWFLERRQVLWEHALGRPTASQLPDELPPA